MRTMMWFRSDLRLGDNPALSHACAGSDDGVIAVFVICHQQWREAHDWGATRVGFLLANLRVLREELVKLGIPLRIVETPSFDGVPDLLLDLAGELGCERLCFNHEYEWNERARDEGVTRVFGDAGIGVRSFHDQVLYEPGSVVTKGAGSYYTVYTPFKKACWARFAESGEWDVLGAPSPDRPLSLESDPVPDRVEGFGEPLHDPASWPAGESEALGRLDAFVRRRGKAYAQDRDYPGLGATSGLSAYQAVGAVSPRQCMAAALRANGGRIDSGERGLVKWMEEVLWREFYRHVLVGFPRVSRGRNFNLDYDGLPWRDAPGELGAWKAGMTGYPIVDAAMRCLAASGWMHNRLRMVVAMFLTKHLLIDWREGERHFMRHLIDGDLASNNGGWQWSASTGTDAQPYFRIFNPTSQSERFDSDGAFIREWVPELRGVEGKAVHEPHGRWVGDLGDYPLPIVDQKAGRERAIRVFKAFRGG